MKKITYLFFFACLTALQAMAAIELTVDAEHFVFTGTNVANNYRFVMSAYEISDHGGPQFQLTINPIDASQPAQFTAEDMDDPNYWEPMFKYYTALMAGEEMTAQDNLKRLYLGDVQLLPAQFIDYEELHIIGFDLNNDYTLPENCLKDAGLHLDSINVKCAGTMTLSPNSLPANKLFVVNVNSVALQQVWEQYKALYDCDYVVNLVGGGTLGDVTGDSKVDIADVNAVINMMLGKTEKTDAADVTEDNQVDIADVNAVINLMLGK